MNLRLNRRFQNFPPSMDLNPPTHPPGWLYRVIKRRGRGRWRRGGGRRGGGGRGRESKAGEEFRIEGGGCFTHPALTKAMEIFPSWSFLEKSGLHSCCLHLGSHAHPWPHPWDQGKEILLVSVGLGSIPSLGAKSTFMPPHTHAHTEGTESEMEETPQETQMCY